MITPAPFLFDILTQGFTGVDVPDGAAIPNCGLESGQFVEHGRDSLQQLL